MSKQEQPISELNGFELLLESFPARISIQRMHMSYSKVNSLRRGSPYTYWKRLRSLPSFPRKRNYSPMRWFKPISCWAFKEVRWKTEVKLQAFDNNKRPVTEHHANPDSSTSRSPIHCSYALSFLFCYSFRSSALSPQPQTRRNGSYCISHHPFKVGHTLIKRCGILRNINQISTWYISMSAIGLAEWRTAREKEAL